MTHVRQLLYSVNVTHNVLGNTAHNMAPGVRLGCKRLSSPSPDKSLLNMFLNTPSDGKFITSYSSLLRCFISLKKGFLRRVF